MASEKETNSVILLLQHLIEKSDIKEQFFIVVTPNIVDILDVIAHHYINSHPHISVDKKTKCHSHSHSHRKSYQQ